jgi:hypothetical protein
MVSRWIAAPGRQQRLSLFGIEEQRTNKPYPFISYQGFHKPDNVRFLDTGIVVE